jgi:hypothetical protein
MRRLLALAALLLVGGACGAGATAPMVRLDGTPRPPSDQGVVSAVSRTSLTLDGRRTYRLTPKLQSFSTSTLTVVSVLQRKGQYVLVGARKGTVGWVASVAAVLPTRPPAVYYEGRLQRVEGHQAVFRDGTVLVMAEGLPQQQPGPKLVRLDPARHLVVELTPEAA